MKFYIFGSKEQNIKTKINKAVYSSSNLEETLYMYKQLIDEIRYDNLYLIADFNSSSCSIFKFADINKTVIGSELPYYIIGNWSSKEDNNCIRCDCTIVKRKGFEHEFDDNLKSLKEYIYCLDNNIPCEYYIRYAIGTRYFTRKISSSDLMSKKRKSKLRKIKLYDPNWEFVQTKQPKISLFTLEKNDKVEDNRGKVIMM